MSKRRNRKRVMKPGQAYALGRTSKERVNAGLEALVICACAPNDDRESYAQGVRDAEAEEEQRKRENAEAEGGEG